MFDNLARPWRGDRANTPMAGYPDGVYTSSLEEQAALLHLLRAKPQGLNWIDLTGEIRVHGGPIAALEALEPDALFPTDARQAEYDAALREVEEWARDGLTMLTIMDDRYPASVRDIHQAPPFLFASGLLEQGDIGVSVVGSRDVSDLGIKMARAVAVALVGHGVTVISGLAKGVDATAHRATLEAGGRPVGVIGTGIRKQYPAENRDLHAEVASAGLLLSQFFPDAPPQKHNFLMRNATMSGYGIATVVIEAGEHSGARSQARMAVEHGRPVILTDLVLRSTQWARQLEGRPGVHVAASVAEVMTVVEGLLDAPRQVDEALQSLVGV